MQDSNLVFLSTDDIERILIDMGVRICYETGTDIICYCPFHDNRDSPAFNISKTGPSYLWKCWNGKCAKQGNIRSLLRMMGYSSEDVHRKLTGGMNDDEFARHINKLLQDDEPEFNEWLDDNPTRFALEDEQHGWPARSYALGRGISLEAFEYFQMGYSHRKKMLIIPIKNERAFMVGVIGRSLEGKQYKYSTGAPRSEIIWNCNNAKYTDSIILTEGALDAVALWQAGYPNVGAVLGSSVSMHQWKILRTSFNEIICFFDNDAAGNSLRDSILETSTDLLISVVEYPDRLVPMEEGFRPLKDPAELFKDEVDYMLQNRTSGIELLLRN